MSVNYYLGIDIGTSSTKSLLMDENGETIGVSQKGYDLIKKELQYAEQDMQLLWEAVKDTIRDLVSRFPAETHLIRGISYSGQMHGLVLTDKEGRLIRHTIIWADQRSEDAIQNVYEVLGKERYRSVTLNSLSTGFLLSSLLWVKEHEPEIYAKIGYAMFPKDYIRFRMCGTPGTDMTDGSGGGVFDTAKRQWAYAFIDELGLPRDIFPVCHESCEPAGTLTRKCAEELGLKEGITIAYGGGDTLMMAVGNGIIAPGVLGSNIGTSCQLFGINHEALYDGAYRTNTFCHVDQGLWILTGANLSGGVALKWLKDQVLLADSFEEMTALADTVPAGSEGMVFLPYLSGERTPFHDPYAKGIYFGMTLKHKRAHFIRSSMEGIVFGMKMSSEIFGNLGITYNKIIASGGGARGRLFLEMQADILDSEIYTNTNNEQACVGAAITAAVACGAYKNYREACEHIVKMNDRIITPNRENQTAYAESYAIYRELYLHNKDLFHREKRG